MPRSIEEILAHADDLAERFENYEPHSDDEVDVQAVLDLRAATEAKSAAERAIIVAVAQARAAGMSWASIGMIAGTTGEAARQRYASRVA